MRRAFTLIELLIVVAIIGILAAIAVPNFMNAQERAKVSRAQADIRSIVTALEMYRVDNNNYPLFYQVNSWGSGFDAAQYEWQRLYPLTTPIAYIATVPMEVFPYKDDSLSTTKRGYMYTDRLGYGEDGWINLHDKLGKYQYVVRSMGPDRMGNIIEPPASPYLILPYSMTNGLASRGDIIHYGP
ncbi:MAG: prepilin-type N-terminal cleavage/methylation domain-containing protein [bacterium]